MDKNEGGKGGCIVNIASEAGISIHLRILLNVSYKQRRCQGLYFRGEAQGLDTYSPKKIVKIYS